MRPVVIPASHAVRTYREQEQLAARIYAGLDIATQARWTTRTKDYLIVGLTLLIDNWIANGALLRSGAPDFSYHATSQDDYDEHIKRLTGGGHSWGEARRDLIFYIGQYCCYCDSPIFSHLHIEHILPKSTFPDDIFAWSNFLLACASCNSAKLNKPNQATIPGHPQSTNDAVDYITNKDEINYYWPSFDWTSLGTAPIFPFRYVLSWIVRDGNQLVFDRPIDEASKRKELTARFEQGTLLHDRGLYYDQAPGSRAKKFFGVAVQTSGWFNQTAAEAVIDATALNRIQKSAKISESIDRRIMNRTMAWFRARILRQRLSLALQQNDGYLRDAAIAITRVAILNTGFWPIWVQVLGNTPIGGSLGKQTAQAYLQDIFRGTSAIVWRLPL